MSADKITFWERMEIQIYKIISYIPVAVTFGVFIFLYIFYITCYIRPSLKGDFYETIGIPNMWKDEDERSASQTNAKILLLFFLFSSTMLFVSIILSITTSPGYIPDDSEWDMPAEQEDQADGPDGPKAKPKAKGG